MQQRSHRASFFFLEKEHLVIGSSSFPVLRELRLRSVWADLAFEPHAMQKLESLLLSFHVVQETCGFSISIGQFVCLEKIEIIVAKAVKMRRPRWLKLHKLLSGMLLKNIQTIPQLASFRVTLGL
jgi:hypothetical protein